MGFFEITIKTAPDATAHKGARMTSSKLFLGMCIIGVIALPLMAIYALILALFGDDEFNAIRGKSDETENEEEEK